MTIGKRWKFLQLADSGFPTGGFAHSAGLEAAVQLGEMRDPHAIDAHLSVLLWNIGHASLPFVAAAYDDPGDVQRLDDLVDVFLTSHVANRASRTQGRSFLATCARVFDEPALVPLTVFVRTGRLSAHLAPLFGAVLAGLGLERSDTLALHLLLGFRTVASAAVRLGVVGPHEAQRLQRRHAGTMDAVLAACHALRPEDAAATAPLLDVFGAAHDRLDARLFQS